MRAALVVPGARAIVPRTLSVAGIDGDQRPRSRIAFAPDGGTRAYVTSLINGQGTGALSIIDTATNHVAGHVILGSSPSPLALSLDGASAYVGAVDSCYELLDVDLEASAVRRRIRGPATGDGAATNLFPATADVAISPDGGTVYVARRLDQVVAAIDAASGATLFEVPFTKTPTRLAIAPDGSFLYVELSDESVDKPSAVAVVDTATHSMITSIQVPNSAEGIAVRPDGRFLYVAHSNLDQITPVAAIAVIDTATNQVTASIPDLGPYALAFTPDGARLYGVNFCGNDSCTQSSVSVIDAGTNSVVGSVPVPGGAQGITIGTIPYGCVAPAGGPCVGDCNGDGQVSWMSWSPASTSPSACCRSRCAPPSIRAATAA